MPSAASLPATTSSACAAARTVTRSTCWARDPSGSTFATTNTTNRAAPLSIARALARVIAREQPSGVYFPLGLFHADHRRTSDAALALIDRFATLDWYAYEDAIYRCIPSAIDDRLRALRAAGFAFDRHAPSPDADAGARKREACSRYRSQLRALATRNGGDDMHAREAFLAISRQRRAA
jgi:LmbE family N-acetylglucosaminyl deacetylase